MKAKRTVVINGASFHIGYAIGVATMIYRRFGAELIITSVKDGIHGEESLHYTGNAADARTRTLNASQVSDILVALRKALEPIGFDVVDETKKPGAPHFHLEYQPKPGESFLRLVA